MSDINSEHFIEELRFDIENKDQIKARLVLTHLDEVDEDTQKAALDEIARASSEFMIPVLIGLLAAPSQSGEADALFKEMLYCKALDNPDVLTKMLRREAKPSHRVLLSDVAGEIKLESATSVLMAILGEEQDEKVLRAAISALGMIGNPAATTPISEYLYSGSVELIIAAIQALGQLSTPTAIQRLAQKLGSEQDLDNMILDVFSYSQEPEALEQLNATLSAQQAHIRNAGKHRLAEIGPKAVPTLISNLHYVDPDLVIHTLNVLGVIGDESAIAPIRKLLHNEPKDANVRFAAYEALGQLPIAKGAFALAQGLNDPVASVRSAAASAINHNYNTVLAAGIKNLVRDEDATDHPISRTIIDAECDNIFIDLIDHSGFQSFAVEYLSRKAHQDTREHYIDLLTANGMDNVAAAINGQINLETKPALRVFAVDDSKMILNIYRSVLHNLGCEPLLFEFPALAIEAAKTSKPDLIFTDLNMPNISGVDLTKTIRRIYSKDELPIIMVTTQNEGQDNEAAYKAGINAILHKPFNEVSLQDAINGLMSAKAA